MHVGLIYHIPCSGVRSTCINLRILLISVLCAVLVLQVVTSWAPLPKFQAKYRHFATSNQLQPKISSPGGHCPGGVQTIKSQTQKLCLLQACLPPHLPSFPQRFPHFKRGLWVNTNGNKLHHGRMASDRKKIFIFCCNRISSWQLKQHYDLDTVLRAGDLVVF